jgi:hypothetical protein
MERPRYRRSILGGFGNRQKISFLGTNYRLYADDREIVEFVRALGRFLTDVPAPPAQGTLVASRHELRAIYERSTIAPLVAVLARGEVITARWAIWLLGRSRHRSAIAPVRPFLEHPEAAYRKEAARALRRLGAWGDLAIAQSDADERVRRLATPRPETEPVSQALGQAVAARFTRALDRLGERTASGPSEPVAERSSMPFWASSAIGPGQQPRADWWLRRILLRVRDALGGASPTQR